MYMYIYLALSPGPFPAIPCCTLKLEGPGVQSHVMEREGERKSRPPCGPMVTLPLVSATAHKLQQIGHIAAI